MTQRILDALNDLKKQMNDGFNGIHTEVNSLSKTMEDGFKGIHTEMGELKAELRCLGEKLERTNAKLEQFKCE